ncbi:2778_t:CDS:2 [Entrophospora sp. SA101]|nr:2778_t:CDS:2 [Entrophospora sp. SA101]CAJ0825307.1 2496_t:CDS:2 [Entrophospora sp. SA101]
MPVCTSCHQTKPDEAFFHKNKKWKTCQHCIELRALKKQRTKRKREEENSNAEEVRVSLKTVGLMELSAFVASEIRDLITNAATGPDGNPLCPALGLRVSINISNMITGSEQPKDIARWIVEEIERADEYNWTYNCMNTSMRHKDVAKFYYVCSQSIVAMKEYKEGSNRKRMERFPCQGKMQMKIDIPAGEAMLEINHGLLHNKPAITSDIIEECRKEIEENPHLNPIQLRQFLRTKNVIKNYTPRQIHSYWERIASLKAPELVAQYSVISPPPLTVNHHRFNHNEYLEYVNKLEQFSKRVRNQLDRGNYVWLDTVKIMTAGIIEMENDIEELERRRANERASKPWTLHYK